jgi:hypothetical protein
VDGVVFGQGCQPDEAALEDVVFSQWHELTLDRRPWTEH